MEDGHDKNYRRSVPYTACDRTPALLWAERQAVRDAARADVARRLVGIFKAAWREQHAQPGCDLLHPCSGRFCDRGRGDFLQPILVAYSRHCVGCVFRGTLHSVLEWTTAASGQIGGGWPAY